MESTRLQAMIRAPSPADSEGVRKFYERQNDRIVGMVETQQAVEAGGHQEEEGACVVPGRVCV
jgi:hypothetical protein